MVGDLRKMVRARSAFRLDGRRAASSAAGCRAGVQLWLLRSSAVTALLLAVALGLTACGSPRVTTNGFLFAGLDLAGLDADGATCEDIYRILRTPTARRSFTGEPFGNDMWFYVGQRVSYYAFFSPEVIEQRVLVVHYDSVIDSGSAACGANPNVAKMENYSENQFRNMEFSQDATVVVGNTRTLLQELFGDIGRFSTPSVQ